MASKTHYFKLDEDSIIRDYIEYEHEGYVPYTHDGELPFSVNGGWYKLLNGKIVAVPELKPLSENEYKAEINSIKETIPMQNSRIADIELALAELFTL
ncbi:hypothetical protein AB4Z45_18700 [Paenibacillus sp. MCAF9]|uniref:hypothetical protein n=1 Tax=Paenibacillus sp. MCAF9 TaxID=3233046 RepID=UPI003F9511C6